jgi:Na+/proline symporter
VIFVLQEFILKSFGIPFVVTAFIILLMILLYTFEGGVKTIVYTDTLQTTLMLAGLVVTVIYILNSMNLSVGEAMRTLTDKGYTTIFNMDPKSGGFFLKQIIGGMFITISMFGLDQEMMQKNISVKNLKDSQKNMITFNLVSAGVNFLFLLLGGLLYLYALNHGAEYAQVTNDAGVTKMQFLAHGKNMMGDELFPTIAMQFMPKAIGVIFIIALISALFPSADGALTALTSSFCIDMLGLKRRNDLTEKQQKKIRLTVHLSFSIIFLICIMIFYQIGNRSIIDKILVLAGYTYGPLLGLFAFGILSKRALPSSMLITVICLAAPIICYVISQHSVQWFNGYQIGIELLIINGSLTYLGLLSISKKATEHTIMNDTIN